MRTWQTWFDVTAIMPLSQSGELMVHPPRCPCCALLSPVLCIWMRPCAHAPKLKKAVSQFYSNFKKHEWLDGVWLRTALTWPWWC